MNETYVPGAMGVICVAQDNRVCSAARREDQRSGGQVERAFSTEQDVLQDSQEGLSYAPSAG